MSDLERAPDVTVQAVTAAEMLSAPLDPASLRLIRPNTNGGTGSAAFSWPRFRSLRTRAAIPIVTTIQVRSLRIGDDGIAPAGTRLRGRGPQLDVGMRGTSLLHSRGFLPRTGVASRR